MYDHLLSHLFSFRFIRTHLDGNVNIYDSSTVGLAASNPSDDGPEISQRALRFTIVQSALYGLQDGTGFLRVETRTSLETRLTVGLCLERRVRFTENKLWSGRLATLFLEILYRGEGIRTSKSSL